MGQIKSEFGSGITHMSKALYLIGVRLFSFLGSFVSLLAKHISNKPKSSLFVFSIIIFCVCMCQQGRVVVAEQGNMKLIKSKDDTISKLKSDVNFYKSMSSHPKEVHDTIKVIKYKPIIKRDSI